MNVLFTALCRHRYLFFLLLAFFAGCLFAGFLICGLGSSGSGELDRRYNSKHGRAAEIIGELERELEQERDINRQLREQNNRARELAEGLTDSAGRNVRNLQDAVGLIGEIRAKLKVLADYYSDSGSGSGGD
jgi:hypothetical protein